MDFASNNPTVTQGNVPLGDIKRMADTIAHGEQMVAE